MTEDDTDLLCFTLAHIACKTRSLHYMRSEFAHRCHVFEPAVVRSYVPVSVTMQDANEEPESSADMTQLTREPRHALGHVVYRVWLNAKLKCQQRTNALQRLRYGVRQPNSSALNDQVLHVGQEYSCSLSRMAAIIDKSLLASTCLQAWQMGPTKLAMVAIWGCRTTGPELFVCFTTLGPTQARWMPRVRSPAYDLQALGSQTCAKCAYAWLAWACRRRAQSHLVGTLAPRSPHR